ncbi:phosphotransferase [Nocardioides endophyticus]|uniref:Phosphotransferase n=1 Tax=Nocardioides endophyticus TaxID=1353775 RepID=A0ABP8ZD15_9ACTN
MSTTSQALVAVRRIPGALIQGTGNPRSGVYRRSRTAVVAAHVALERALPARARGAGEVPASPDAVSDEWLTDVLCGHVAGARVIWSSTVEASVGSSTRWRSEVRYNAVGDAAGLPTTVFSKTTQRFKQRLMLGFIGILPGEPTFFRDYRPGLDIEAPLGFHGGYDPQSWRSIAVIEDIGVTKGAEFVTALRPISRAEIEDLLANLAVLHGRFWEAPEVVRNERLHRPIEYVRRSAETFGIAGVAHDGVQMAGDAVPVALRSRTDDALDALWVGLEECSTGPMTLLHGDPHIGNTYVTDEGRMGLNDWQIIQRGSWQYDVTYLVNGALSVEDRRAWEQDLLGFYLERLAEAGGPRLEFQPAWAAYRRQAAWPYFAWLMTLGHGGLQPDMQPDEISIEMVRRTAAALDDHGILG